MPNRIVQYYHHPRIPLQKGEWRANEVGEGVEANRKYVKMQEKANKFGFSMEIQ